MKHTARKPTGILSLLLASGNSDLYTWDTREHRKIPLSFAAQMNSAGMLFARIPGYCVIG